MQRSGILWGAALALLFATPAAHSEALIAYDADVRMASGPSVHLVSAGAGPATGDHSGGSPPGIRPNALADDHGYLASETMILPGHGTRVFTSAPLNPDYWYAVTATGVVRAEDTPRRDCGFFSCAVYQTQADAVYAADSRENFTEKHRGLELNALSWVAREDVATHTYTFAVSGSAERLAAGLHSSRFAFEEGVTVHVVRGDEKTAVWLLGSSWHVVTSLAQCIYANSPLSPWATLVALPAFGVAGLALIGFVLVERAVRRDEEVKVRRAAARRARARMRYQRYCRARTARREHAENVAAKMKRGAARHAEAERRRKADEVNREMAEQRRRDHDAALRRAAANRQAEIDAWVEKQITWYEQCPRYADPTFIEADAKERWREIIRDRGRIRAWNAELHGDKVRLERLIAKAPHVYHRMLWEVKELDLAEREAARQGERRKKETPEEYLARLLRRQRIRAGQGKAVLMQTLTDAAELEEARERIKSMNVDEDTKVRLEALISKKLGELLEGAKGAGEPGRGDDGNKTY